jgi:two-component system nitrogen regulation sensor histidine kinase GlnL
MVIFSIVSSLTNAASSLIFGVFVIRQNSRNAKNRTYFWFSASVALWSIFYFLWQISKTSDDALFNARGLMLGAIFIPVFYLHHIVAILGKTEQCRKQLIGAYVFAVSSSLFSFTPFFVSGVAPKLSYPFWPNPGFLFHPFLLFWVVVVAYGVKLIFESFRSASGIVRNQMKYILLATIVGWGGGLTNYFLWYDIPIPPYGNILVSAYIVIVAYVIIKYQLMDVRLALTFTSLFLGVYGLVFGIPVLIVLSTQKELELFWGNKWWVIPVLTYAVLSMIGPYIYSKLRLKVENRMLREQRAYQQTLLQASRGMTLVKDMDKLLKLIVHILTKTVKITHARIFLWDPDRKRYESRAVRGASRQGGVSVVDEDSELVRRLREGKQALVLEELQSQSLASETIIKEMIAHGAALIIPSFIQDRLLGFLVLGEKKSKQLYTESDLDILKTLANQAALAIENCIFLTEFEHQQAHFFQAAKMADLGTMASGIAHQVNNRFNVIKLGAESALMVDFPRIEKQMAANNLEGIRPLIGSLESVYRKIAKNADHGGEIVRRLLDFSRLSEGFGPVNIGDIVASCVRLWECKHPVYDTDLRIEIPGGLARIHGNSGEIEEVLFNLLDNAYDAIKMKEEAWECGKLEKPEHPAKGRITLSAREALRHGRRYVEVTIADSGLGMPEEVRKQVFVPFFTTKATAIKGTGLGLYVIRKMVDAHQGEIELESVYGEGTTFRIFLPATGET